MLIQTIYLMFYIVKILEGLPDQIVSYFIFPQIYMSVQSGVKFQAYGLEITALPTIFYIMKIVQGLSDQVVSVLFI